jgi:putative FmdB family regulatory protein
MPVYDFTCRACGHEFEQIVLPGRGPAACPECQSQDLERMLSSFAVSSDSTRQRNLDVARKRARTSTGTLDQKVADHEYVKGHYADEGVDVSKWPKAPKKAGE